jgi:hypothetical protein
VESILIYCSGIPIIRLDGKGRKEITEIYIQFFSYLGVLLYMYQWIVIDCMIGSNILFLYDCAGIYLMIWKVEK